MSTGTEIQVVMPQMGVSVSEGTITKWLKQVGEAVARDELLLEISTDKVDTEVPSPGEGVVAQILVQEGQTVDVGTVLATIAPAGSAGAEAPSEPTPIPAPEPDGAVETPPAAPAPEAVAETAPAAPEPAPSARPQRLPAETERASSRPSSPGSPPSTASTRLRSRVPAPAGG